MFVVAGLHFLAFIIWAGVVQVRFSGCDSIEFGSDKVCGEGGAAFALWNLFYFTLGSPVYFLIAKRLKNEENLLVPVQQPMNTGNQNWRNEITHEALDEESNRKQLASKNYEIKKEPYSQPNLYAYVPPPPSNND